jgi:hypothetical protein
MHAAAAHVCSTINTCGPQLAGSGCYLLTTSCCFWSEVVMPDQARCVMICWPCLKVGSVVTPWCWGVSCFTSCSAQTCGHHVFVPRMVSAGLVSRALFAQCGFHRVLQIGCLLGVNSVPTPTVPDRHSVPISARPYIKLLYGLVGCLVVRPSASYHVWEPPLNALCPAYRTLNLSAWHGYKAQLWPTVCCTLDAQVISDFKLCVTVVSNFG